MIKVNRVRCCECGVILESMTRHDFKMCECTNESYVDGGHDYQRLGGVDLSKIEVWDNKIGLFISLLAEVIPSDRG